MWSNNTEGNKEHESRYENDIFKKIELILDWKISLWDLVTMSQKNWFKRTIDDILNKYADTKRLAIFIISEVDSSVFKSHKNLHTDIDVVKLAIQKDSNLFNFISSELIKNKEIWKEVVKSMVRENKNFYEVDMFITTYFIKDSKEIFDIYFQYLENANKYYTNDLSKNLFSLKKSNKSLYNLLQTHKLFTTKWKIITINNDFIKKFVTEIVKDEQFQSLTQKEKDVFIILKLGSYFNISNNTLSDEEKVIFDLVLSLINIEISKKIKELMKKEEKEKPQPWIPSTENEKEASDSYKEDDFNEFADFSYPECNSYKVSWWYNIETITWKKIFITDAEKDNFTTKALKNYIKFYNTLYNLWLNFLWDKYSHDFKILCNNKFWFDYMHSEWITDWKMLSILNMIWRNVWIPEHKILNDKWEETNEVKCFNTLWDAKDAFWEIKETWIINGTKYSDSATFWNWAVENRLIEVLCIDQKGHGLNISKWR